MRAYDPAEASHRGVVVSRRVDGEVVMADLVEKPAPDQLAIRHDLCHAAVSTWLNGGVPATQVAEWAGQSIEILLRIYAKCLDGEQATMRRRVGDALGLAADAPGAAGKPGRAQVVNLAASLPRTAVEGR